MNFGTSAKVQLPQALYVFLKQIIVHVMFSTMVARNN